ncbi:thermonuclease family protein [Sphingomonas sp. Leaf257]|jgi:endonuclease YncB( thermonuclease family)|uniref:thermonuclease family protein n=1 Tax=Sphingomonas sp. Leaf257 TaxID=1736309 RepID=UPI0006F474E1|nr:thermonuclease family protein [Sphingomonas sp. Leaf257]KQO51391.1 nuclease [Sphingomonas sp. Leaf257]
MRIPILFAVAMLVAPQTIEARGRCSAVDGDTLRCGRERIRLIGIDAPEMPGHCRAGRRCVIGDPFAARYSLTRALVAPIAIERVGRDRYGRTLAFVSASGKDLSCIQLRRGQAKYRADWDKGGRIGRC